MPFVTPVSVQLVFVVVARHDGDPFTYSKTRNDFFSEEPAVHFSVTLFPLAVMLLIVGAAFQLVAALPTVTLFFADCVPWV